MNSTLYSLQPGRTALLISLPHVGTQIPEELRGRYTPEALALADTDWHLEHIYDFAAELGASLLVPRLSRYVIDLNRPPRDEPLYQGANNTELCPTRSFSGEALYRPGCAPAADEITRRRRACWEPYHEALRKELDRLRAAHGHALLLDGHSIRSQLPWLFAGTLPDLNLGTASGHSCAPQLRTALASVLAAQDRYTQVVDGRFRGGYITRQYGRPLDGVHAVQMEMCWSCYMREEPPYAIDEERARPLRALLRQFCAALLSWKPPNG